MFQVPLWTLGTFWIRDWSFLLLFFFFSYSIVLLVSEASLHILPTERKRIWEREIEFKELAHKILGAGKSKSTGQANRLETQRRVHVSAWAQSQSAGRIPSSLRDISLSFMKGLPLIRWGPPSLLQIWKTQQWPQDWKTSVFIPIPKKGNVKTTAQLCSFHMLAR